MNSVQSFVAADGTLHIQAVSVDPATQTSTLLAELVCPNGKRVTIGPTGTPVVTSLP